MLTEPIAVAVRAAERASAFARVPPDRARILVIGGGAIGLLCGLVLRAQSFMDVAICEISAARRETCRVAGFGKIAGPEQAAGFGPFDIVIDAVGKARTRRFAQECTAPGGVIVHVGLSEPSEGIDFQALTRKEITVAGAACPSRRDFETALSLLASDALGRLEWVETRRLEEGPEAFSQLAQGRVAAAKVVD